MIPALLVLLAILLLFFGILTSHFFTFNNFKAIISNMPVYAVSAAGLTFVIIASGLDLSVGSVMGFAAVTGVLFHLTSLPLIGVLVIAVVIGACWGAINGLITNRLGINPVITTLGMMTFIRGLCSWLTLDVNALKSGRITDNDFLAFARYYFPEGSRLFPITMVYVVVIYALLHIILRYTVFGRRIFAVGSNAVTARMVGINVKCIRFYTYIICGALAAFDGIILLAQIGIGRDDAGLGAEMEVITICVIGGISLSGGKGNILGMLLAVLIMGIIRNGMVHLESVTGISYFWRDVVKGGVLILAIVLDAVKTMAIRKRQEVRQ